MISACSLREDIAAFEDGDLTLIGERGVTLSGGQKTRVSLARAVYQEADIYLLDDPLSAVDIKVGRDIFDNCVREFLSDKIVVMVTHQIQYVRLADEIVVMKEGTVVCSGAYNDIVENEFCKEFLIHLEKIEERDLSQINRLRFLNLDSNFSNFSLECGEKENNKPLTLFTTTQDYRPDTTSLSTYVQYFCVDYVLQYLC